MRSDLVSLPGSAFDLVGPRLSRFFSCIGLFGSASGRGDLQAELLWPPLISLGLLFRFSTHLSFTDYRFWVFRLALFSEPGLSELGQGLSGMFGIFPTPSPPLWLLASGGSPVVLDFPVLGWRNWSPGPELRSPLPVFPARWISTYQMIF